MSPNALHRIHPVDPCDTCGADTAAPDRCLECGAIPSERARAFLRGAHAARARSRKRWVTHAIVLAAVLSAATAIAASCVMRPAPPAAPPAAATAAP